MFEPHLNKEKKNAAREERMFTPTLTYMSPTCHGLITIRAKKMPSEIFSVIIVITYVVSVITTH
jgi:hypothetical protein